MDNQQKSAGKSYSPAEVRNIFEISKSTLLRWERENKFTNPWREAMPARNKTRVYFRAQMKSISEYICAEKFAAPSDLDYGQKEIYNRSLWFSDPPNALRGFEWLAKYHQISDKTTRILFDEIMAMPRGTGDRLRAFRVLVLCGIS